MSTLLEIRLVSKQTRNREKSEREFKRKIDAVNDVAGEPRKSRDVTI